VAQGSSADPDGGWGFGRDLVGRISAPPERRRWTRARLSLFFEAALLLATSYIFVMLCPMRWWAPLLGSTYASRVPDARLEELARARVINSAVSAAARRSPVAMACLPRSITRHLMMRRRGIASTIYIGMRSRMPGKVDLHAWVAIGPIVIPAEDVSSYSVVAAFS
jgi:hypothetical protein